MNMTNLNWFLFNAIEYPKIKDQKQRSKLMVNMVLKDGKYDWVV